MTMRQRDGKTERRRDGATRGRGDGVRISPRRPVALSPRLLVSLSLLICLLAAPTRQAQQQNPQEKEGKAKTPPPICSHVILITISGLRSDFVTGAESQRL